MHPELERKISAARARLLLDKPFLGALVLRLPMVAADPAWCATTATDMRQIYFNPRYLDALGTRQVEFVLAHEALHCALSHFTRRGHRDKRRWDLACDFAINPLLLADGLVPPSSVITFLEYSGMTAEEIYPLLQDNDTDEPMDQHLDGAGGDAAGPGAAESEEGESGRDSARPKPMSAPEREALAQQWQHHLAAAAQRAAQAGKLGGDLARLVEALLQPRLSWRAMLAHYMSTAARNDFDYTRPSRRESVALLPGLRSRQIDVAVVIDTSGSITDGEIREFFAEVDALKAQVNARVTLFACDTELADEAPWIFEVWDEIVLPVEIRRGGGTRFAPPFDWIERASFRPDALVYFTDACGEFPAREPDYPVVWLVKGKHDVPWGQRIQLN